MEIFKRDSLSIISAFWLPLCIVIALLFLDFGEGRLLTSQKLILLLVMVIIFVLPTLILFFGHWKKSKGVQLLVDKMKIYIHIQWKND
jgi:hypothetical protein